MNRTENILRWSSFMNRLMKWPLLCGLLSSVLTPAVFAADSLFENDAVISYPGTEAYPPQIDATNFVNTGTFTINYTTIALGQPYFETSDTVNYTNIGSMEANTGFQFDNQSSDTGSRIMSGSFYNSGTISCGFSGDTIFFAGIQFVLFPGFGQCFINATNIVSPGTINAGENGRIQFTGKSIDLSRTTLNIEGNGANVTGTGVFGLNTNFWDPSSYLGANFAQSAPLPVAPFSLFLTNSTAFFKGDIVGGGAYNIIRSVFIQDTSLSNVSYKVYFDTAGIGVGNGNATIEWTGWYTNIATGELVTNYLYMNDNYGLGASTNVFLVNNGYPDNFTFTQTSTPQALGLPATSGFFNVFQPGQVTNLYSFANVQLISTTVGLNTIVNGAITNLPGRILINASNDLDLSFAQIAGPNYLSMQSPYQFEGSAGAAIQTPYADINVGVTNGFLTITNLMEPFTTNWNGPIQAWNTRWISTAGGVTNDYRVLIVGSQLTPITLAQVQDLFLHGTNSIVISDTFNVIRKLSADAQNLTLTTNNLGVGATSLEGELNLNSASVFFQTALPNLLNLTNNGAIRTLNLANFGSTTAFYNNFINNYLISDQGSAIYAKNFASGGVVSNGVNSFTLKSITTTLTNGLIIAGGDISITANNLVTSNLILQAGRSLTLQTTNLLTDSLITNGNIWTVGGSNSAGLNLPIKPLTGDLLGTTISNMAPFNKKVINTWAGQDLGYSVSGYSNNAAIGRLIIDAATNGVSAFNNVGTSNAIYVDYLELRDWATNRDLSGNPVALTNSGNMVIYYAYAVMNGVSVSDKLNHKNSDHLRWVPAYVGHFSSTNLVFGGVTNTVNAGLAQSTSIDSDGDGIPNAFDPTPFFTSAAVNFALSATNIPSFKAAIQWQTIPGATNFVFYKTNLLQPTWLTLTNFITPSAPPYGPITNLIFDTAGGSQRYYRVQVNPNTTGLYGP